MKKLRFLAALALPTLATIVLSQTDSLHQFSAINFNADRTISLRVTSAVPTSFRNYYDLFPIEVSQNLVDWLPLTTLVRTNSSTNAALVVDSTASNYPRQFYRTPTNQLSTPIPPPDGPYRVGVVSRLLTDPSRTNRYVKTNSSFMVSIWYPAQPSAGVLPGLYLDPQVAAFGPGFCITANYKGAHGHALPSVPLATNESKYPLVIYSHGYQIMRTDNTRKVENLASFGFVVLAIDHGDCYATVFPDGKRFLGLQSIDIISTNRTEDIRFILQMAAQWNTADPLLQGRLDLDHAGIFGHSAGGGTSSDACSQFAQIKAGLSLDGGYPIIPIPTGDRPFLILGGGDTTDFLQPYRDAFRALFDRLTHDAWWVHLKNSTHCDFNETPWFDSPTSTTLIRRALVQDLYVVSFFKKYLQGEDDHFLDAQPSDWPEVDAFLKK